MSEFTVCRTLDTYPALKYCLLLDDDRIAGGKPDYRGDNFLISWRTKETYGPVDALMNENAKLREARGTCHVECYDDGVDEALDGEWCSYAPPTWYLSCEHEAYGVECPSFCPVCGRQIVDEEVSE